jgi:hypothetical protein
MSTLAGVQDWTDQDGRSAGHHSEQLTSRALSLQSHTHSGHDDYYHAGDYSSVARDAWSCPQGFEPSSGICQGMLLVSLNDMWGSV